MSTRRPKIPIVSSTPERVFVGYMAFNHATGAMCLAKGYSMVGSRAIKQIYANASAPEGTLFENMGSALIWIDRTIKNGRSEWKRAAVRDGDKRSWQDSNWKWLFRQTWSVVPVFMALPGEHPTKRTSRR